MFRSLTNDSVYRMNRVVYTDEGKVAKGNRLRIAGRKSQKARTNRVLDWISYEFYAQKTLYEAGAHVPKPLMQTGNAVLMEYVGAVEEPALLLREVRLEPEEASPLFKQVIDDIALFLSCNIVHGDLSAYNILYWQGTLTIIDFAQAVDPRYNQVGVYKLFARDVERVCSYFARYGVEANGRTLADELWERYMNAEL
jgi:RIO kinase 1